MPSAAEGFSMTITFRYFERPHDFSTYQQEPARCEVCEREGYGYEGPFYGLERDIEFVCEDCLSSGRLQALDIFTNEGDLASLRRQLRELRPRLSGAELNRLVSEREAELCYRTPHLTTWQDFFWPAHCGDFCRFVKEIGKPELSALAHDGDGVAFLAAHARDISDLSHAREVWEDIRPDIPRDGAVAYSVGVYLFRCVTCDEPVLLWDCD